MERGAGAADLGAAATDTGAAAGAAGAGIAGAVIWNVAAADAAADAAAGAAAGALVIRDSELADTTCTSPAVTSTTPSKALSLVT